METITHTVPPQGENHSHTIILLHARDSIASEFASEFFESQVGDGQTLLQVFPTFKWVFPVSRMRDSARFESDFITIVRHMVGRRTIGQERYSNWWIEREHWGDSWCHPSRGSAGTPIPNHAWRHQSRLCDGNKYLAICWDKAWWICWILQLAPFPRRHRGDYGELDQSRYHNTQNSINRLWQWLWTSFHDGAQAKVPGTSNWNSGLLVTFTRWQRGSYSKWERT